MWYKIHSLHTQPARGVAKIYWRRCQCFEKNLFLGHQHLGFVFEGSQAFSFGHFLLLDSLQSSTIKALNQTQVSTMQSQVLVTQKRKVFFHTSTDFGGISNGLRFGGSMVIREGWWDFDLGLPVPSSDWSELLCMARAIFTLVKSFFFRKKHLWNADVAYGYLVGVNHSRIVVSLASIRLYCQQGKPPKHLKVKSQAAIIYLFIDR